MGKNRTGTFVFREGGKTTLVPFQTNSAGFRDRERRVEKPPGTRRVAVLGDSFVAGMAVPQEQIFSRVTEELLKDSEPPTEVLAFGVVGYSTSLELKLLEEVVVPYSPEVVVLSFFQNDPTDNHAPTSSSFAPYLRLTEDGGLEWVTPRQAGKVGGRAHTSWLNQNSRLYLWQKHQVRKIADWWKWRYRKGRKAVPRVYHSVLSPRPDDIEAAWRLTRAVLTRFADACKVRGIHLILMDIPFQEEVSEERLQASCRRYPQLCALGMDWSSSRKELTPLTQDLGIEYLDLRKPMSRHPAPASLYFEEDGHLTEAGHRFVAEVLKGRLDEFFEGLD